MPRVLGPSLRVAAVAALGAGCLALTSPTASATGAGGTSVASATLAHVGVPEFGNTASGAHGNPPNDPCYSNNMQFWKVPLLAGDQVTVTGQATAPASNIYVWFYPAGTTDDSFTTGNWPKADWSGSTQGYPTAGGVLGQTVVFTVPSTGVYPFLVGQCNGQTGPYEFELSVVHAKLFSKTTGGGTWVASATLARFGVKEFGNTYSGLHGNPPNDPCYSNNMQFWKVPLLAGDQVTVTGQGIAPASNIYVWFYPAGTTDDSFTTGNWPKADWSGSTQGYPTAGGVLGQTVVFTVPSTGVYPFLVGQCNGQTGPYEFELSVVHEATLYAAEAISSGTSGALTLYVRSPSGAPVNDPRLVGTLYGIWRTNPVVPTSRHLVTKAPVVRGMATLKFRLPAITRGTIVTFIVAAAGPGYRVTNQLSVRDAVKR